MRSRSFLCIIYSCLFVLVLVLVYFLRPPLNVYVLVFSDRTSFPDDRKEKSPIQTTRGFAKDDRLKDDSSTASTECSRESECVRIY